MHLRFKLKLSLFLVVLTYTPLHAQVADGLEGTWRTEGYGYILDIKPEEATLFEVTSISCIESVLALGAFEASQGSDSIGSFRAQVPGFIDAPLEIRKGEDKNTILLRRADTVTQMTARRISGLPEICKADTAAANAVSLQIFKQTFLEHYAFLDRLEPEIIQKLQSREISQLSDQDLFRHLVDIAKSTGDQHAVIIAPQIDGYYFGDEEFGASFDIDTKAKSDALIARKYLGNLRKSYGQNQIFFGNLKAGPAYLRIDGFSAFAGFADAEMDTEVIERAMAGIVPHLDKDKGLILDMRTNRGGSDELALSIAGWLTDVSYTAYRKQAIITVGGHSLTWNVGFSLEVTPSDEARYTGPIVILTGPQTVSAGETFIMAMMNRKPEVVRVGERTAGAFSDRLPRRLPNGWLFSLSNERYLDQNGVGYEGRGIAPDIEVPVFSIVDTEQGIDMSLERAVAIVTKKQ